MSKPITIPVTPEVADTVKRWRAAKEALAQWKQLEAELRETVVKNLPHLPEEGSQTYNLDYMDQDTKGDPITRRLSLRVATKINRTIAKDFMPDVTTSPFFDKVVSYRLNKTFQEHKDHARELLADVMTEKPGMPTITL